MIGLYRRWGRLRRWRAAGASGERKSVDGVGELTVYPVTTAMYFTFRDVKFRDMADHLSVCAWMAVECVEQYFALTPVQLARQLSPSQLLKVSAEIMALSGLTAASQEAIEKKSEAVRS